MNYQAYGFGDNSSYSSQNTYEYYVRAVRNFSIPKETTLNIIGNTNISGALNVSSTFINDSNLNLSGSNLIIDAGNLYVSGGINVSGSLTVSSTYVNNSNVNLDQSNLIIDGGDLIVSGTSYFSGSLIPNTADGTYTSSFSLGSNTHAWKDLWISKGSIIFLDAQTQTTSSFTIVEDRAVSYTNGITASYFDGDGSRLYNLPSTLYWNDNRVHTIRPKEQFTFGHDYVIEDMQFRIESTDEEYNYGTLAAPISFKKIGRIFIGDKLLVKDSSIINDGIMEVGKSVILDGNVTITGTGKLI
jgi:hypothetical protein